MFLIFGIDTRASEGFWLTDGEGGRYFLYYTYSCFSLFFIPLFRWGRQYFLKTENRQQLISKEDYEQMKRANQVMERYQTAAEFNRQTAAASQEGERQNEGQTCANDFCPVCKHKLERQFTYCPYCGQKQPRR